MKRKRIKYRKGHDPANHPGASRQEKADWLAGLMAARRPVVETTSQDQVPWEFNAWGKEKD